ncbi:MAG: ribosome biogenesis GTPase Der [Bacillota bacterium]|nr:ribosome biogenesis GTPase Der [Bacillota bacterium]
MTKPLVAVVGRPNVGKSTLFNHVIGTRLAIVDDRPGVTRDRLYADGEWLGRAFTLIDTGGIEPDSTDSLLQSMRRQAEIAIETGDVIIFIVDLQMGLVPADLDIATLLRRSGKPVLVAVNKVDRPGDMPPEAYEFYRLGFETVLPVSAAHGLGIGDLLDAVIDLLPPPEAGEDQDDAIRVAIIGKPNSGKSSLVNRLVGEERAIVSDMPGTTRDTLDSVIERDGQRYIFVDTAGIRRRSRIDDPLEHYSVLRALAAIKRADVCLLLIDAEEGSSEQDARIAGLAHNEGKATIIVVNKWDLIEKTNRTVREFENDIRTRLAYMPYAPLIFISAKTGQRVERLPRLIREVYEEASKRIPTGVLNSVIGDIQTMNPAPSYKGRRLKISYATQVAVRPPLFVLFVNDKELMHFGYERHIENELRRQFGFRGTPIHLSLRSRGEGQREGE